MQVFILVFFLFEFFVVCCCCYCLKWIKEKKPLLCSISPSDTDVGYASRVYPRRLAISCRCPHMSTRPQSWGIRATTKKKIKSLCLSVYLSFFLSVFNKEKKTEKKIKSLSFCLSVFISFCL